MFNIRFTTKTHSLLCNIDKDVCLSDSCKFNNIFRNQLVVRNKFKREEKFRSVSVIWTPDFKFRFIFVNPTVENILNNYQRFRLYLTGHQPIPWNTLRWFLSILSSIYNFFFVTWFLLIQCVRTTQLVKYYIKTFLQKQEK